MKKLFAAMMALCMALAPLSALAEELVMFANAYSSTMNEAFQEAHPEVTIRTNFDADPPVQFDQVLMDLVSRNYVYDLFNLWFSGGQARRLSDRLYLVDLGQSEVIRGAVEQLPEAIRSRVTNDKGEIFALPYTMEAQWGLMGFNTAAGEALGIEKPQTWEDFLNLLANWEYDYADEAEQLGLYLTYDDISLSPRRLFLRMFDEYVVGHADGRRISFATPTFTALMALFDGRRAMLADLYDRLPHLQGSLPPWDRQLIVFNLPLLMDVDDAERYAAFEPMPLSVTADPAEAVIPVDMMTLSVSGGAPHADLAMTYAETLASSMDPMARILFAGGADDTPVEREDYASTARFYERQIAATEMAVEDEGETPELMEELEQYRLEQADNERMRYRFSGESIRSYAALAPYLRPMPPIGYEYFSAQQNTAYFLAAFESGEMPVDQFIREFEQVQSMMMLEDE